MLQILVDASKPKVRSLTPGFGTFNRLHQGSEIRSLGFREKQDFIPNYRSVLEDF